uniref:NTF2 domain-containing protein n=1 Tax=Romanomermis culicivorax TaxID=13658 RepID=A0A915HS85_ROMCU
MEHSTLRWSTYWDSCPRGTNQNLYCRQNHLQNERCYRILCSANCWRLVEPNDRRLEIGLKTDIENDSRVAVFDRFLQNLRLAGNNVRCEENIVNFSTHHRSTEQKYGAVGVLTGAVQFESETIRIRDFILFVEPFDVRGRGRFQKTFQFDRPVVVLPGHRLLWEMRRFIFGHCSVLLLGPTRDEAIKTDLNKKKISTVDV